jgi:hypothetical protein
MLTGLWLQLLGAGLCTFSVTAFCALVLGVVWENERGGSPVVGFAPAIERPFGRVDDGRIGNDRRGTRNRRRRFRMPTGSTVLIHIRNISVLAACALWLFWIASTFLTASTANDGSGEWLGMVWGWMFPS